MAVVPKSPRQQVSSVPRIRFTQIRKRDGRLVPFDPSRITEAILKAGRATGEFMEDTAGILTDRVLELAAGAMADGVPNVEWMQDLASQGMGGILADDMGLGKTLQTLAFLYSVGGSALVVCPSSLVHNWVAEARKFTPELKAVAIEGADRARLLADPRIRLQRLRQPVVRLRGRGRRVAWHDRGHRALRLRAAQVPTVHIGLLRRAPARGSHPAACEACGHRPVRSARTGSMR